MSTLVKTNSWSTRSPGDAFAQSGRRDEAVIWFRKALATDPGDVEAACGLVKLLLDQRSLAEAIETLQGCLLRNPFNVRLLAEQRRIGLALYDENLWEDAERWLGKALELEPWDVTLASAYSRARTAFQ
jgi:tetratricopeptide (TPR) repeat protein